MHDDTQAADIKAIKAAHDAADDLGRLMMEAFAQGVLAGRKLAQLDTGKAQ